MHYENKHDDLILSDIDEMRKLASPQDKPSISVVFTFIRNVRLKNNSHYIHYFQMERTKR